MIKKIEVDLNYFDSIFDKIDNEKETDKLNENYNEIEKRIQSLLLIEGIGSNMGTLMRIDCLICRFSRLNDINGDLEKRINSLKQQLMTLYDGAP